MTNGHRYKVVFLITSLNRGGAESRLVDVLRHLDRARFNPFLFVGKDGGELLEDVHDQRVYIGVSGGNILRSLPGLWKMLAHERPHAVWCVQSNALSFFGRMFARMNRARAVIISLHGIKREDTPVMDWPNRLLTPSTTDRVVVLSQQYRTWAIDQGIPEGLLTVQYNGVDTNRFCPDTRTDGEGSQFKRELLSIDPARPVIGTVGNLRPIKAHEVLLQAAARVTARYPNVLVVLVGEGERREELERLAQRLNLSQNVRFLGMRQDVPDLMRAFDIFALTSNSEGCPNVILEAMASGLPVVSTRVGGVPELVHDETGILVSRKDDAALATAISDLLDQPERRQVMGQAARQRAVEHFSLERMIQARERLLLELLEAESGRNPAN